MALTKAEEKELLMLLELEAKENAEVTTKQKKFIYAKADEVLYGGAAGGGKSYGQLIDANRKALQYPGIRQLILRRTFPELKRSLITVSFTVIPNNVASYNQTDHIWNYKQVKGHKKHSIIEFGFCDSDADVTKYQSAEYDIIRFDELTHFSEFQYSYLISRIRGANPFPKQIKSSTNPGGIGHGWVKARFIDNKIPEQVYTDEYGRTSIFIPAKVQENTFLMEADPKYIQRLEQLPEIDKEALLHGNWDIFEGQYFTEFNRRVHVIEPFNIPDEWRRYVVMDYGLDMLACYWIATDQNNKAYVYKELYQSGLIISDAAQAIHSMTTEKVYEYIAPPDLWNKRQETGKSAAEIFGENGIWLVKASNDRIQGWYNMKEWLKPYQDEFDETTANLLIFKNCVNLIRCLPEAQCDQKNPNDVAKEPHEITHSIDAIRYFLAVRPCPTRASAVKVKEKLSAEFKKYDKQMKQQYKFRRRTRF